MRTPRIGLDEARRANSVEALNGILSDAYVLLVKTRKAHWDIAGPQFRSLHALWDEQYEALEEAVDEIAERVRMLGGIPVATMAGFLEIASLREDVGRVLNATQSVEALLDDHEAVIRSLRAHISKCDEAGDQGTADLLTQHLRRHEKDAWMLRSFLEGDAVRSDGKRPAKAGDESHA